jgi:hypothetical protein
MESLSLFDREIEVDESGAFVESVDDKELDWDRLRDCNDSYTFILIPVYL